MNFGPYPLVYNIVKGVSKKEDVTVLSYGWPKYPKVSCIDNIKVIRAPLIPSFHSSLKTNFLSMGLFGLKKVIEDKPDIINSQDMDGSFLLKFSNLAKIPAPRVVSLKGSFDGWLEKLPPYMLNYKTKKVLRLLKCYEKTCVYNSDKIIVPSNFLKNDVLKFYDVDEDKILRVHNGVDTSMFFPKPVKKTRPILFFTGGDSYRKGADIVVESFIRLKRNYDDLQLIISGSTNIDRFHSMFNENGIVIGEDVLFKGKISYTEMPYYFNLCDIFLMPSYHETFCTAVAEAMACGKPVVVANDTALPEVVGNCGLLVDAGNIDGFVDAISRLLDDDALRKRIGLRARKRVENLFFLDRVIKDYLRLFRALA